MNDQGTRRRIDAEEALTILRGRRSTEGMAASAMFSSYLGGVVTDPALMAVPIDDHMVHRGHGVFDTATLRNGRIYRLDIHLDRMMSSAHLARIEHPFTKDDLRDMVLDTVIVSGEQNGSIRYWMTAGPGGFSFMPSECVETCFYCVVMPETDSPHLSDGSDDPMQDGIAEYTVVHTPMKPKLLAKVKSNNYLLNVLTHLESADSGGKFGILIDADGYLAEGCVSNVSFVLAESRTLVTPPFDDILSGTTVRRMLTWAEEVLVPEGLISGVEQRPIHEREVRGAGTVDEMFLTGGDTHVFPVTSWDDQPIGSGETAGKVGPVAKRLLTFLEAEAAGDAAMADAPDHIIDVPYN